LSYVRDQPDGFVVLSRDAPVTLARGGMSSLLNDVAERVADVFTTTFKKAGYDPKTAPIYAHALVGMVTFVGQWWTETRKPPIEDVASHIAALAWMGLRHLPKRPKLFGNDSIVDPGSASFPLEQAGVEQELQVVADGRLREVQPGGEMADTRLSRGLGGNEAQHEQASGIRDGFEGRRDLLGVLSLEATP